MKPLDSLDMNKLDTTLIQVNSVHLCSTTALFEIDW